ncbi:MAG: 2-C-methyl-D-erythritol 4-phosphate cytidylyltransferase [Lachnospiraceae bacterium]|nr:2-C-methyl-D-erythritol 4-phosphate cytidylyltransferase [Lachnospiraceae bacterium]
MGKEKRCTAIVLAAGQGRRMHSTVPKQFLLLEGKPILVYALECFQNSELIDQIILVTGEEWIPYCREKIVNAYKITKVTDICTGGAQRYDSVNAGLSLCRGCDYVFIHDGARPFVTEEIVRRGYEKVSECQACVAGMPSKDTVKIVDRTNCVIDTPARSSVWNVQTPQVFSYALIRQAYACMQEQKHTDITDDAMVVERFASHKVSVFEGSYRNIKITTEDDLDTAEIFAKKMKNR